MKVLFATDAPFPFGSAGSSRIRNMARGLIERGNSAFVLLANPPNAGEPPENYMKVGYQSVFPRSHNYRLSSKSSKIAWYIQLLQGAHYTQKGVLSLINKGGIDAMIVYSWNAFVMAPSVQLAYSSGVPVFIDVVEWPTLADFRFKTANPMYWSNRWYKLLTRKYSNGILVISSVLEKIFSEMTKETLKIPALIEPDFFSNVLNNQELIQTPDKFQISFIGALSPRNDPRTLAEVAIALNDAAIPYRLNLIGSANPHDLRQYLEKDEEERLKGQIHFWGRIADEDLKRILLYSDLLLLPRLDDFSNRASFPTRLPEMLMSGRPVIISSVGDIPEYLEDGVHAMLPPPGNGKEFARRAISVLNSYSLRQSMGLLGKERALEAFSYPAHIPRLLKFIST